MNKKELAQRIHEVYKSWKGVSDGSWQAQCSSEGLESKWRELTGNSISIWDVKEELKEEKC